ncbi:hypothetical protein BIFLH277_01292 [Bifidobacterium longum subsp. longum]|nr:hypothetical protein BIFLH206_01290 [Bifidobacterium longum subsp. longum]VWQ36185.1 hypothetical protein BIFLH277_01292 [Bifidobacterium longum subsp. longum]
MVVNALPVGRDGGASSGVISNGAVADEVIRDDAVHDGEPPLKVLGKKVMYQEQGGADFAVTQVALEDVATGNHFAVHYASVKGARPGAVCVAERDGRVLLARHWRVSTESWEWEFPRGMGEPGETPVVPEFLRTLVFARPRGDDQFADCTFSPSLDMSR